MSPVATAAPAGRRPPGVPRAGRLRTMLRRGRRANRPGSTGEALTDGYMALLFLAIYGWAGARTVAEHVPQALTGAEAGARAWLAGCALVALSGAAWRGLRALGPLFATPAGQAFALSTPVSRRGWLAPRLAAAAVAAAAAGALAGAATGGVAHLAGLGWAVLAGALLAAALVAAAVALQAGSGARWGDLPGTAAVAAGVLGVGAVVGLRARGVHLPAPAGVGAPAALVAGAGLVAALVAAVRRLARVDRAALAAGAEVAAAAEGSAMLLDPTLLSGVLATRRWRRLATVASRPVRPGPGWLVLLRTDLRRQARRPGALVGWAVLLLTPYAAGLIAPAWSGPVRIVAGYLAADRLAGGLRAVCRSGSLRRLLGGTDLQLHLAHLAVPAVGLAGWWALTLPAVGAGHQQLQVLLAAGVLAAVYRSASRRPISYSGMAVDTPMGLLPLDLIRQLLRGPDALAAVVLLNLLLVR